MQEKQKAHETRTSYACTYAARRAAQNKNQRARPARKQTKSPRRREPEETRINVRRGFVSSASGNFSIHYIDVRKQFHVTSCYNLHQFHAQTKQKFVKNFILFFASIGSHSKLIQLLV